MGLISFIRGFNEPADMPQAEKDAIMAAALAEHDEYTEALAAELNSPDAAVSDRNEPSPSLGKVAAAVAIGTAIGKRL